MASVSFVRGKHRALVRVAGFRPVSKSFSGYREAEEWGRQTEAELRAKLVVQPDVARLDGLIKRYIEEHPKMGRSKRHSLLQTAAGKLGKETLAGLTVERIVRFGRDRGVAGITLTNDLSALSTVLKHAEHVWRVRLVNPIPSARYALRAAGLLDPAQERDRRPTEEELERIDGWLRARRSDLPIPAVVRFAVVSAMRQAEITSLLWKDYNRKDGTVLIRERKHPTKKRSNDQVVPLLKSAQQIIEAQPRAGERIFPVRHNTVSCTFSDATRALGIDDLHFHDLRHEAISRLFEMGYQIQEVAMFSGHRDWKQLKRYTQLRADKLRRLA